MRAVPGWRHDDEREAPAGFDDSCTVAVKTDARDMATAHTVPAIANRLRVSESWPEDPFSQRYRSD